MFTISYRALLPLLLKTTYSDSTLWALTSTYSGRWKRLKNIPKDLFYFAACMCTDLIAIIVNLLCGIPDGPDF